MNQREMRSDSGGDEGTTTSVVMEEIQHTPKKIQGGRSVSLSMLLRRWRGRKHRMYLLEQSAERDKKLIFIEENQLTHEERMFEESRTLSLRRISPKNRCAEM